MCITGNEDHPMQPFRPQTCCQKCLSRHASRAAEPAGLRASFRHPIPRPCAAGLAAAVSVGARGRGEVVALGEEVHAPAARVAALQAGGGRQAPPAVLADHVVVVGLKVGLSILLLRVGFFVPTQLFQLIKISKNCTIFLKDG